MADEDASEAGAAAAASTTTTQQQLEVELPGSAAAATAAATAAAVGPLSPHAARSARAVPFLTGNPHTAHQRAVRRCCCSSSCLTGRVAWRRCRVSGDTDTMTNVHLYTYYRARCCCTRP